MRNVPDCSVKNYKVPKIIGDADKSVGEHDSLDHVFLDVH